MWYPKQLLASVFGVPEDAISFQELSVQEGKPPAPFYEITFKSNTPAEVTSINALRTEMQRRDVRYRDEVVEGGKRFLIDQAAFNAHFPEIQQVITPLLPQENQDVTAGVPMVVESAPSAVNRVTHTTVTELDIKRYYDAAMGTLRSIFGAANVEAPEKTGLAVRTAESTYRGMQDFFRIDKKVFEKNFPGQERAADFIQRLEAMGIKAQVKNQAEETWGKAGMRPYVCIDAVSLITAMGDPDFLKGRDMRDIMLSALENGAVLREASQKASTAQQSTSEQQVHHLLRRIFGAATPLEERPYKEAEKADEVACYVVDLPPQDAPGAIQNLQRFLKAFSNSGIAVHIKSEYLKDRTPRDRRTIFIEKSDLLANIDAVTAAWSEQETIAALPVRRNGTHGNGSMDTQSEASPQGGAEVVRIEPDAWQKMLAARAAAKAAEGRNA